MPKILRYLIMSKFLLSNVRFFWYRSNIIQEYEASRIIYIWRINTSPCLTIHLIVCTYSISMVLQMMLRQQEISYAKRKYLEMPNKPISCCFLMVLVSVIHSKDNSFFLSISVHKSFKLLSFGQNCLKIYGLLAIWQTSTEIRLA